MKANMRCSDILLFLNNHLSSLTYKFKNNKAKSPFVQLPICLKLSYFIFSLPSASLKLSTEKANQKKSDPYGRYISFIKYFIMKLE